jgi:hypothetical protein
MVYTYPENLLLSYLAGREKSLSLLLITKKQHVILTPKTIWPLSGYSANTHTCLSVFWMPWCLWLPVGGLKVLCISHPSNFRKSCWEKTPSWMWNASTISDEVIEDLEFVMIEPEKFKRRVGNLQSIQGSHQCGKRLERSSAGGRRSERRNKRVNTRIGTKQGTSILTS